jgi:uncharacterized protein (TIGR03066 family)
MRTLTAVALIGIGFAPALAAPVPKDLKKSLEDRLVGVWKMVKSDTGVISTYTFTITFKKGGDMVFTRTNENNQIPTRVSAGKFKAGEPNNEYKLGSIDWKVTEPGGERGEVSKILKLTDTEMIFEDPEGLKETFERVKDEKKDK